MKNKIIYFLHPLEDCAVKVEVINNKSVYSMKFKGEKEYKPDPAANIIMQARVQPGKKISEKDYINF